MESIKPHAVIWQAVTITRKYYCDTCDKSFKTDDDMYLHEAEHETCGREGCEFTAHPKIIAKHIKMQHDTGLYERIGKLYTEEDIAKWIEERKKRYPSRKVIEEKKAMEQEKINRGERIKEDDSKFNKAFSKKNRSNKNKNPKNGTNKTKNRKRRKSKKNLTLDLVSEEPSTVRAGIPAFTGIKNAIEPDTWVKEKENDLDISDDEWEASQQDRKSTKPILNHSLGLLASCYNSDADIADDSLPVDNQRISDDEGSAPEEVKTIRGLDFSDKELNEKQVFPKRKLNRKSDIRYNKKMRHDIQQNESKPRNSTLLEKLLKKEIRHERNVILQCIHYVVKNKFFQKS